MSSVRPLVAVAVLGALSLAATGCRRAESASVPAGGAGAAAPRVLTVGNGAEPQDLDPQTVTGVPENKLINAFFEGLVSNGPTGDDTVGGVAERWEVSPDGLRYTFHLRADARWSNGDPVTAEDFIRSYRRMLSPEIAAEYAYKLFHVVGAEEYQRGELKDFSQVGFRAPDARTLEIRLKRRVPFLLEAMKHYSWYPVHIPTIEKHGGLARRGSGWTRVENFVGNGPFVLREWRANQQIVGERSPTYWDRANVQLDQIRFLPVESIDAEERMFRRGQLDKTYELPLVKIDEYRRDRPESYRQDPYYGSYFFRFNVTRKPFDDVRVRRALALAIDRESLTRNVVRGGQVPAYALTPPSAAYTPEARLEGTLDDARRLLAEAGFPGGKGFPPVELLYNTQENHRKLCEAIQEMWRRNLGIEVTLVNQEWKVYMQTMNELQYDIARGGWIGDYLDPHTFLDTFVTGGGNNRTGWGDARYDALLEQSYGAPDEPARMRILQEMERILLEQVPIIPIYYYTRVYALSPRVHHPASLIDNQNWKHVRFKE